MLKKEKIFVLDTSVLLHDHQAITNFKNNNVTIPITVLEELDKFKVGNDTKNFCAREVIRFIDKLSIKGSLQEWISLGKLLGKFKIVMDSQPILINAEHIFLAEKNEFFEPHLLSVYAPTWAHLGEAHSRQYGKTCYMFS